LNQEYTTIGKGKEIEIRPSVVHFGGFEPHATHEARVLVVNTTNKSIRFHVVAPETPFFKLRYSKKGPLPPGMSETLFVEFTGTEHIYYTDFLRIHSELDHLYVPLHAYPAIPDIQFPRSLDFGILPIDEEKTQEVVISNPIPVQFEFAIDVIESCPDFEVSPLRGMLPGHGSATIRVTFHPRRLATLTARLRFQLSQFNFEPVTCTLTGSAGVAIGNQETMRNEKLALYQTGAIVATSHIATAASRSVKPPSLNTVEEKPKVVRQGGGAGGGDYVTQMRAAKFREKVRTGTLTSQSPSATSPTAADAQPEEDDFVSLKRVSAHATVAKLLNQKSTRGGSDTKTLRGTKALGMTTRSRSMSPSRTGAADVSLDVAEELAGDYDIAEHEAMAVAFRRKQRAHEEWEKSKSVKWFVCIGQEQMSQDDMALIVQRRRDAVEARRLQQLDEDRQRKVTVVLPRRTVVDEATAQRLAEDRAKLSFNVFENDGLAARRRILEPFVAEARAEMVRYRVKRRLTAIRQFLVQLESKQTALDTVLTPEDNSCLVSADKLVLVELPVYRPENFAASKFPEMPATVPLFEDWELLPQKTALEYKIKNYVDEPVPSVDVLPGRELKLAMQKGAFEQSLVPVPAKAGVPMHTASEVASLSVPNLKAEELTSSVSVPLRPEAPILPDPAQVSTKFADPYPDHTVIIQRLPFTEVDPEYLLRAVESRVRSYSRFETPGLHTASLVREYHTLDGLCPLARDTSEDVVEADRLASGEYDAKFLMRPMTGVEKEDMFADDEEDESGEVGFPRAKFDDVIKEFGLADILAKPGDRITVAANAATLPIPMPSDGTQLVFDTPFSLAEAEAERRIKNQQDQPRIALRTAMSQALQSIKAESYQFSLTEKDPFAKSS
jgi:hypothetical protein